MSDLIDRQAAIEALHKKRIETMEKGQDVNHIWECLDVVAQLPSVQSERGRGKWIPCSEQLPEYGKEVLTINTDGDYEINHIIDEEDSEWFYDEAIAWMPLPELWEGGNDE